LTKKEIRPFSVMEGHRSVSNLCARFYLVEIVQKRKGEIGSAGRKSFAKKGSLLLEAEGDTKAHKSEANGGLLRERRKNLEQKAEKLKIPKKYALWKRADGRK